MANYQIKRTVGEHYEDTSYSSAKEAIAYLKPYSKAEAEAEAKKKENEEVEKKKKEKKESKKKKEE